MSAATTISGEDWSLEPEPGGALGSVWEELTGGYLRVRYEHSTADWLRVIARVESFPGAATLSAAETETLLRVLSGEPLKSIAIGLTLAASTISERCARALRRLDLAGRPVPVPIVVAAQRSAGLTEGGSARSVRFVEQGVPHVMLSIPRPEMRRVSALSEAERDVGRLLIEGFSCAEIAEQRGSSIHTVANQQRRVFSTLRIGGRYALIRRAAELGCFD